jgi:hypothetical protein
VRVNWLARIAIGAVLALAACAVLSFGPATRPVAAAPGGLTGPAATAYLRAQAICKVLAREMFNGVPHNQLHPDDGSPPHFTGPYQFAQRTGCLSAFRSLSPYPNIDGPPFA